MPAPILIILHQEHSTPGRVGHVLKRRGYSLDVRRPRLGDPLPETLAEHAGVVPTLGDSMSETRDRDRRRRTLLSWTG